ncbi:major facilitator superfamily domain-containing protein [Lipomyces doorenjongii]|uniref:major facilitator superfamily domain-containing protein n=1 Tax=Lipomyces doorenjongii TaxID=383834 RepID=UPI0034CDEFDE
MAIWPFNRNEVTMDMIAQDPTCDPYYDPPGWKPPRWRVTLSFFWESIAKPPGERRYVNKLDRGLLVYLMLSYFIKALDQRNISNAYVSGMKQALHLDGNEYNYFTTLFNCGYLVGSIPSQLSLSFARPSIMIPSCEILWTVMVMLQSRSTSAKYIYICRFFQGFAESICYPTMMMIIGSWYKPEEIAKRVIIWDMTGNIASMFSGYLQAAIYTNLNGVSGFAGWQWLFIIDGVISLPIGLFGYFAIPDFPTTSRAVWLTDRDKEYSIRRMTEVGRKGTKKMTVKRFFQIFTGWRFWAFITPYAAYITGAGTYMNLWLQAVGYDVQMTNILPTIGNAISLVSGYIFAILSDITRWRWQLSILTLLPYVFGNLVLAIWDVPFGWKFAANLVPNIGSSFFSLFMAWESEVFQDDTELRGYLPAIGNAIWYCQYAWFPVVAFPAQDAPHYKWGYWAAFGLTIINIVSIYAMYLAIMWDVRRRGLVMNKYGLYVEREDLVDYSSSSLDDIKGPEVLEQAYETGSIDVERDSDLIETKKE